ncbi:MAG: RluA family pseudouridine synthase, partial [Eubacterium sp.]|nr:RluA family pseudouridine synthase [Eubacterium sp.]
MSREQEYRYEYIAQADQEGLRLDQFLAGELKEHSRSYIQKLIREERACVNGKTAKASLKIHVDDRISLILPPLKELAVEAEKMDLDILYEDPDLILINKPKNMVVHPAPGNYSGTLVNGLLYHCGDRLSGINGVLRPGIVHRIDKDTTGVLVVCKTDMAHRSLAEQLKDHSINRSYEAIVYHNFREESGTVEGPIGRDPRDRKKMAIEYKNGKPAVTHYEVLDHLNRRFNHIRCRLETGRTHQIRVHM